MNVTPGVAQNKLRRKSAGPDEIAQSNGCALPQRKRKQSKQGFGCAATVGGTGQVMVRGIKRVDQIFVPTMAAYNLVRMRSVGQTRLQGAQ